MGLISTTLNVEDIVSGVIAQINEDNKDIINLDEDAAMEWSPENKEMIDLIYRIGYDRNTTINQVYIANFYSRMALIDRNAVSIDKEFLELNNLVHLNISKNRIKKLENLPLALTELICTENGMEEIADTLLLPNLLYLNIAHNNFQNKKLAHITTLFPRLTGLDVSFNNLTHLQESVEIFSKIVSLKLLSTQGNPIQILRYYKSYILGELHSLRYFDNQEIIEDDSAARQNIVEDYNTLMKRQYGDDYEDKVAEHAAEAGNAGKNKKNAGKKGDKQDKPKEAPKKKAQAIVPQIPQKEGKDEKKETEESNNNMVSSRISFDEDMRVPQDFQNLSLVGGVERLQSTNIIIEVKTLEQIKPIFLEDNIPEQKEGEPEIKITDYMTSYWFEFEFSNLSNNNSRW